MKHTARQTSSHTIADMYRAMDRHQPVTITYVKADGSETLRTIEIHDIRTTKNGDVILRAADRHTGEMRSFRADRIDAYTLHRNATYQVQLPADETPAIPAAPATVTELIARELDRDDQTTHAALAA